MMLTTSKSSTRLISMLVIIAMSVCHAEEIRNTNNHKKYLRKQQQQPQESRLIEQTTPTSSTTTTEQVKLGSLSSLPVAHGFEDDSTSFTNLPSSHKFNWSIHDPNSQMNGTSGWTLFSSKQQQQHLPVSSSSRTANQNAVLTGTYLVAPLKEYQVSLYDSNCINLLFGNDDTTKEQKDEKNNKKNVPVTLSTATSSSSSNTHQPVTVHIEIDSKVAATSTAPSESSATAAENNLDFCVRLDLLTSGGESVNFHESKFSISPEMISASSATAAKASSSSFWSSLTM